MTFIKSPVLNDTGNGFKWLSLIFMMLMGALLGILLGFALQKALNITDNQSLSSLRIMQLSTQLGLFLIPSFLFSQLFFGSPTIFLKIRKWPKYPMSIIGLTLMLSCLPLVHAMAEWNKQIQFPQNFSAWESYLKMLEERAELLTNTFLSVQNIGGLIFNLFMVALVPAVGEELLFRATIQQLLIKTLGKNHLAIFMAALIFSILHFQFYGLIPRFFLGLILGYLFFWSQNLWVPVMMHFLNNALAVVAFYLHYNGLSNVPMENFGSATDWWQLFVSLAITAALLFVAAKLSKKYATP